LCGLNSGRGFLITKEKTMTTFDRRPPGIEELKTRLAARNARNVRVAAFTRSAHDEKYLERRQRSLRSCHLPAAEKELRPRRENGAYVPQLSASVEDDPNLSDGARHCARKLAEYVHRCDRENRSAEITVTFLMKALRRDRRTVQRYLRQLERAGYIAVEVLQWRTRMCAGLLVKLLAPLLPRHGWPEKAMKPGAARKSQNYRSNIKTERFSRESWALKCMDGVFRSLMATLPRFPALPSAV
jgi:hypothetical protein